MDFKLRTESSMHDRHLMNGIAKAGQGIALDLGGPIIEPFTLSAEDAYCVMKGTLSAGVSVPLHSHGDSESFYALSGEAQVLLQTEGGLEWQTVRQGDFVHIPGETKHAWRNRSTDPFEAIITTTPKLGRFLRELGELIRAGGGVMSAQILQRLTEMEKRYGYWSASPAENAAIGIVPFS